MTTPSGQLATFAAAAIDADAAGQARAMMRLSLLDWAAVALAGRDEKVAQLVREMVLEECGRGFATLVGSNVRVPARAAALANGTTSHALDYDDTHFANIGHPSVAVIPAALAVAEATGAGGAAFLDAALVGVEASIRVGIWLGRSHYQTGFHQTATAGAFGATLAAARLKGLSAPQTAHALGLAATRAAGLKSQFGSMGKPYHAGLAAQTGVEAAWLAQAGFISNPAGLECEQGFGPTHAGEANAAAFDGIGQDWLFETVSHKFHACCHGTHAMIEALKAIGDTAPGMIERITVTTHPRWLSVCDIAEPATGLELKFSYRMIAAMVLTGHDTAALSSFTDDLAQESGLRALAARVVVETDPHLEETAARVSVIGTDGQSRNATHDLMAPISMSDRRDKLLSKTAALLGETGAGALWQNIGGGSGPDLAAIAAQLSAPKG